MRILNKEPSFREPKISNKFDILVYGPNEHPLNTDTDLNGASRRALTIAFILALTKVSEVTAPNVIDTPLGMMDGFVKRSVLKTTIQESSQLILFLTRSEIKDCEDIIADEAGTCDNHNKFGALPHYISQRSTHQRTSGTPVRVQGPRGM